MFDDQMQRIKASGIDETVVSWMIQPKRLCYDMQGARVEAHEATLEMVAKAAVSTRSSPATLNISLQA